MEKKPFKFTHDKEFHDIVNSKEVLRKTTEKFLNNIIDEITFGIIFDLHKESKIKTFKLDENESPIVEEELAPNVDIFGQSNMKETLECDCPNCNRVVLATSFAPHLEVCMGMGRSRSRNASRRIASNNNANNKKRDTTPYTPSDDEDDADWSSEKRRKKKQRNGNKKGKGTPKKVNTETEATESVNVDIEGDEEGDMSLQEYLQDHSNHSSPSDTQTNTNSATSSSKRKDKSKSKKNNKRDRTSPCSSVAD